MPRILVVDDSPTILKVVSAILTRSGHQCQTARDGVLGLKALADDGPFDLILLDFVMPRMNGYQFCRELRKDPASKAVPVVLMSAKGDRIRAQFVNQTGAVDAVTKPFDARALVAVVEGVLERVKAGRAPAPPEGETMPDEESLGTDDSEPRPSLLPRQLEARAVGQIVTHVTKVVVPAIRELKLADRGSAEALSRAISTSLQASPLDLLLTSLREATSASAKEVLSGDTAFVALPEVIQLLSMQCQTGVMRVVSGRRSANMYLREGLLDLSVATGDNAEFKLGRYFFEMGLTKRAEIVPLVEAASKRGARLGDHLVATGKITDAQRREALKKQSCEILYDVVRWPHGRFWFARDPHIAEAEHAKLGLALAPLVLEGFRRVDEWRVMEGTIAWEDIVVVDEAALQQVGANLTSKERMVLALCDGKRQTSEIVEDCDLSRFDTLKILYQFLSSRVLRGMQRSRTSELSLRSSQAPPPRPIEEFSTTEGSVDP